MLVGGAKWMVQKSGLEGLRTYISLANKAITKGQEETLDEIKAEVDEKECTIAGFRQREVWSILTVKRTSANSYSVDGAEEPIG